MMKVTLKVGEPVAAGSRVVLEHAEDSRTTRLKVLLGSFWHFQMTSVESISIVWRALPKAPASGTYPWSRAPTVSTLCGHTRWCLTGASPGAPRRPPSTPAGRKGGEPREELGAGVRLLPGGAHTALPWNMLVCPVQKAACGRACQRPWELLRVRLEGRVWLGVHGTSQRRPLCAQAVSGSQERQTTNKG